MEDNMDFDLAPQRPESCTLCSCSSNNEMHLLTDPLNFWWYYTAEWLNWQTFEKLLLGGRAHYQCNHLIYFPCTENPAVLRWSQHLSWPQERRAPSSAKCLNGARTEREISQGEISLSLCLAYREVKTFQAEMGQMSFNTFQAEGSSMSFSDSLDTWIMCKHSATYNIS